MTKLTLTTCLLNIKTNVADVTPFLEKCHDFWVVFGVERSIKVNET